MKINLSLHFLYLQTRLMFREAIRMHSDDSTNNSEAEYDSFDEDDLTGFHPREPSNDKSKKSLEINEIKDFEASGERHVTFLQHGKNMFKLMKELKDEGELLDLSLKVNSNDDKDVIRVHGCVMAAHSPFIRAFLRNENKNRVINLTEWNKEVIECLVNWMYDGVLKIQLSNCYEILDSSDFLCLGEVSQECVAYICDNLKLENCCEAYVVACRHPLPRFKERVTDYFVANFAKLIQDHSFVDFPKDDLLSILKDDRLLLVNTHGFLISPAEEEMMLFKLLKDFINLNKAYYLWPDILKNVIRYGLMDKSDLRQLITSNNWLEECNEKKECLEFLNYLKSLESTGKNLSEINPLWTKCRDGLKNIAYFGTREVAFDVDFPELPSYEWFDDVTNELKESPLLYVTGMKMYTNMWENHLVVSTIEVTYNTGKKILHGIVRNDMQVHEFKLNPDERIVSAKGRTGWLVDQLCFVSNLGRTFGPYGGNGGSERDFKSNNPGSYLTGIRGCVSTCDGYTYVRRLRFVWGYMKVGGGGKEMTEAPVQICPARASRFLPLLQHTINDNINGTIVVNMVL